MLLCGAVLLVALECSTELERANSRYNRKRHVARYNKNDKQGRAAHQLDRRLVRSLLIRRVAEGRKDPHLLSANCLLQWFQNRCAEAQLDLITTPIIYHTREAALIHS